MKNPFVKGNQLSFKKVVTHDEIASFESGTVHEVYSTFSIARDAEWSGRLFVLEMKEEGEEGIGTQISVQHKSPAFIGDEIHFISTFEEVTARGEIMTSFKAYCGDRLIAEGVQGQKILRKEKIDLLFDALKK